MVAVQKEPVGCLAGVSAGSKIDLQGAHQVAPPLPVVRQEGGSTSAAKDARIGERANPASKGSAGVLSKISCRPAIGEAILTGDRVSC
jgi:hypothetical protein